jgi:hypothetical protein
MPKAKAKKANSREYPGSGTAVGTVGGSLRRGNPGGVDILKLDNQAAGKFGRCFGRGARQCVG